MSGAAPAAGGTGYRAPMPRTWWLRHPRYFLFMMRELSSVFVAIFLLGQLCLLRQVTHGPNAFEAWIAALRSPFWIFFHVFALEFALLHSVTWLNLTGKVQVVRLGSTVVSPALVTAAAYATWVAVTAVLTVLLLRV